jgi:tellurite methyltransferase
MTELWDILDENGDKTGRLHERGKPMMKGDYHLVVHVWIMNGKGEFLISQRSSDQKAEGGLWETTGGAAVAGDDSLKTTLKETSEEIGIQLDQRNGQLFKHYCSPHNNDEGSFFTDVWLYRQEADIASIIFQPEETCNAMWASQAKIRQMIAEGLFITPDEYYPYLDELFFFSDKPFWEIGYKDITASTFAKGPTKDVADFYLNLKSGSHILDVGCGEGRNAMFLAEQGHQADAFDLSEAGIKKAMTLAKRKGLDIHFSVCDLGQFIFVKDYDVILSHGVLHLPEKAVRDEFITNAQEHTKSGGYHIIGVFTNRLPATPDNAPFTKSLYDVGELPAKYAGWKILSHEEGTLRDTHPGGGSHEHAYERIIAQKVQR